MALAGKLIVIDGTDGSGKATQTDLLIKKLQESDVATAKADFPQYGKKSAGPLEEYLNSKYGTAKEVGPYRASILFAVDRFDGGFQVKQWLAQGKMVISNRYVTANMGHQGAEIPDDMAREKYFKWLDELEFGLFGIPRPDLNIILHVPAETAQKLVDQKGHRDYVGGKKRDMLEADLDHLKRAEKTYLQIAGQFPNFKLIECAPGGELLSIEAIHNLVWQAIEPLLK